jgi:hypothetical protein
MPKTFRCDQAALLALTYATYEIEIRVFQGAEIEGGNSESEDTGIPKFGFRKNVPIWQRFT